MIASERPVEAVELAFGRNAVGEPRLRGGELEQLVFRPDGGVTFRLRPTSPARHPTWWSARAQYVYLIGLEMPETPIALPFAVSIESAGD